MNLNFAIILLPKDKVFEYLTFSMSWLKGNEHKKIIFLVFRSIDYYTEKHQFLSHYNLGVSTLQNDQADAIIM